MAARYFQQAREALAEFEAAMKTLLANRNLSAEGARSMSAAMAAEKAAELREMANKLRASEADAEKSLTREMMAEFNERPSELADVQEAAEIRSWLSTLPETQRFQRVRELTAAGDRKILRALLTVPTYLSPIPEDHVALIRDEAVKNANPERYATVERFRKSAEVIGRALEGVAEYVTQEASAPVQGFEARQRAAQGRPPIIVDASGRRQPDTPTYRPAA